MQEYIENSQQSVARKADTGLHILLAEDDDELRALLVEVLVEAGHEVTECPNGWSLLGRLRDYIVMSSEKRGRDVDLVVSDIRMPGVTGLEILEGLQHREGRPPIILITAFGDRATHEWAQHCGAAAILDKPLDIEVLLNKVIDVAMRLDVQWHAKPTKLLQG